MSAVTKRFPKTHNGSQFHARDWVGYVKAAQSILMGWLCMRDASGFTAPVTAATGYTSGGVAMQDADNTAAGAVDGDVTFNVEEGIFSFDMGTAGDVFSEADEPCPAYGIDNHTVGKTDGTGTRSPVAIFLGMDPEFPTTKVLILVGRQADAILNAGARANALVVGAALTDTATQTITRAGARNSRTVGTISQNSVLTLSASLAQLGDRMIVTRKDATSAFTYSIANGGTGAGTLMVMPASKKNSFEAYFDGTDWQPLTYGVQ